MRNILVIDDNPEVTDLLETALTSSDCRVVMANNGREGLRHLDARRFDVVITDIIMPVLDGFEVIMEINKMAERPRVIAMTGGTSRLSRDYLSYVAKILRVERVLYKPFTMSELLETVGCRTAAE